MEFIHNDSFIQFMLIFKHVDWEYASQSHGNFTEPSQFFSTYCKIWLAQHLSRKKTPRLKPDGTGGSIDFEFRFYIYSMVGRQRLW